jgi:phenylpropionate dioxygenase-like ring-hydroxylating dioxygenase large terminal subunit
MESTRELPARPKSWFLVTEEKNISEKPFSSNVAGLDIILFRTNGKIAAIDRRCSHMNADLALGCVIEGKLQCSLHHLQFDEKGNCKHGPKAKLNSYAVQVRHGFVFLFNDEVPTFDLPFFEGVNPDTLAPSSMKPLSLHNEWFIGAANAFDINHFEFVHLRHLLKTPLITHPDNHSFRIHLDYEIRGNTFSDKLMKIFYGKKASLNFTVYAGNFILAVTTVKDLVNYMMIVNAPVSKGNAEAKLMVFGKKSANPFKVLKRELQAHFSQKFFQDEADNSAEAFIDNKKLSPEDKVLAEYISWLLKYYSA